MCLCNMNAHHMQHILTIKTQTSALKNNIAASESPTSLGPQTFVAAGVQMGMGHQRKIGTWKFFGP